MSAAHEHTIEVFRPEHLDGVRWIEERYAQLIGMNRVLELYTKHPGYSGFCNGRFVGAGGIVVPYPGFGEGWAVAGPLVASHHVFFHRTIRLAYLPTARMLRLRRLQAMVRSEFTASQRWLEHLGFRQEAVLRRYGVTGEDMVLYVLFPDEVEE